MIWICFLLYALIIVGIIAFVHGARVMNEDESDNPIGAEAAHPSTIEREMQ